MRHSNYGGASITVVFLVSFIAVMASSYFQNFVWVEYQDMYNSLTRVQAYWAAVGHRNYYLSRVRFYVQSNALDSSSSPTFDDFQSAFNSFNYQSTALPSVCSQTLLSNEILKCILHELFSSQTFNYRSWDYSDRHRINVGNGGEAGGILYFPIVSVSSVNDEASGNLANVIDPFRFRPKLNGLESASSFLSIIHQSGGI